MFKQIAPLICCFLPVVSIAIPPGKNLIKAGLIKQDGHPLSFFTADNPAIQYMGRIDFSNPRLPRFWAPGVTVRLRFQGPNCRIILHDEVLNGNSHNYVEVAVEGERPYRIRMKGRTDTIEIATSSTSGKAGSHIVTICKDTESGIGWLEFEGVYCEKLLAPPPPPARKIEFIGNSITCGSGIDVADIPCGQGTWYDQHNAWMSYGARTARDLQAQWHLSSVSGIGLVHSCCDMNISMPEVFDKMNQRDGKGSWNFGKYIPDVVTVCLGQNDGIQDSAYFCGAFLRFARELRRHYPKARIVFLNSPMADSGLTAVLKRYILSVVSALKKGGDERVSYCFFSKRFDRGCGGHPDMQEHAEIAAELTGYLGRLMGWR